MKKINYQNQILRNCITILCISLFLGFVFIQKSKPGFAETRESQINSKLIKLQLPFIVNKGQCDENVKFYARTFGGTVFITKNGEIIYSLPQAEYEKNVKGLALKEEIIGGKVKNVMAAGQAITRVSYFKGKESSKWQNNIPAYELINMGEVYEDIDLKLKAYGNNVEKLFIVKSGAKPENIRLRFIGAKGLRINKADELEVDTDLGLVTFSKPVAYQENTGKKNFVEVAYIVNGDEYGFTVNDYDREAILIIDPLLASTFLGGSDADDCQPFIITDGNGDIYVAGHSFSSDFPTTPGVFDESFNGDEDIFISKLDGDLKTIYSSTYLGGGGEDDGTCNLILDKNGNVYVVGFTISSDFPTTPGAYNEDYNGGDWDVFLAKFNSDLTTLLASTFLGGSDIDVAFSIALDNSSNVCVTGVTLSSDFPTTPGAYNESYNMAYISRLNSDLTSLTASTFLGGNDEDWCYSITLDESGNVYVAGTTLSSDFPTTAGAFNEIYNGGDQYGGDAFVSKFNPDLTTLSASTFLGGSGYDGCRSMTLDESGNVYLVGDTWSSDFPTNTLAYDQSHNGDRDIFISRLDNDLTILSASTLIGGSSREYGVSITLDGFGNVYVTGGTESSDFPTTSAVYDGSHNGYQDGYVSRLDNDLTTLSASTFIGGAKEDYCSSITLDGSGNVYVAGITWSLDFPTTRGAYAESHLGGDVDVFISKFDSLLSFGTSIVDKKESAVATPTHFVLYDNYPNPFNPVTTICFDIPFETNVYLSICDISGKLVKTLLSNFHSPGKYVIEWDGADDNGQKVVSGVYFYCLETPKFKQTNKMILLK